MSNDIEQELRQMHATVECHMFQLGNELREFFLKTHTSSEVDVKKFAKFIKVAYLWETYAPPDVITRSEEQRWEYLALRILEYLRGGDSA